MSNSDSDGGVLIGDFHDHEQVSQKVADVPTTVFTFRMLLPDAPFPANLILVCTKAKNHTPHDHDPSHANYLAFDTLSCSILPKNAAREAPEEEASSASITDITDSLSRTTLSNRAIRQPENNILNPTPRQIRSLLRHWKDDPANVRYFRIRAASNPYPGVAMNFGWNRARWVLLKNLGEVYGTIEDRKTVEEGFRRFTFARQTESFVLPQTWGEIFAIVFIGSGYKKSVWTRGPGSWWAARKGVFYGGRGSYLMAEVRKAVKAIERKIHAWRDGSDELRSERRKMKRKRLIHEGDTNDDDDLLPVGKKHQTARGKPEEVMSEAWRLRRRLQERRAGRWTDGTLRMDRLWDGFYWVLHA